MLHIVMAAPLRLARPHRDHRLAAIERLDLRLFVDAQHHRVLGRRQIQPNHIAHLGDEVRIGRQLERLLPVRLQPKRPPDPLHRADRQAAVTCHVARTPVRRIVRLALQRAGDNGLDPRILNRPRRARARFVAQAINPLRQKPAPPLANRHGMHAKFLADRFVLQPCPHGPG
jgi:hypothetical protein